MTAGGRGGREGGKDGVARSEGEQEKLPSLMESFVYGPAESDEVETRQE